MKPFPDAKCRKTSKSFVVSLELPNFAAEICKLTPKNNGMKKKKLKNCVNSAKLFGSVESFNYFCR